MGSNTQKFTTGLDTEQLESPVTVRVNGADFSLKRRRRDGTGLVVATLKLLDDDGVLERETSAFRGSQGLPELNRPDDPEDPNLIPARNLHLAQLVIDQIDDVAFEPMREAMEPRIPDEVTLQKVGVITES